MIGIVWRRFRENPMSVAGLIIILMLATVALFAPLIAPYGPATINVYNVLSPPDSAHLLGTDDLGRDVLSRIIWGSRASLKVGFIAVGIAITIGTALGAIAGFYGGTIDSLLMRFVDIMLAFPTFFLILAVIAIVEPSISTIMIIIGLTGWMDVARLVRAEFLTLKEREFVSAARVIGASDSRIIFRHIIPNALSPVFVAATFGIAGAIL
ncbi:MAG: ABC transporter permease, partial [Dissulfurispiraceae bacterium]